jgi:hypothetical protein
MPKWETAAATPGTLKGYSSLAKLVTVSAFDQEMKILRAVPVWLAALKKKALIP